MRRVRGLLVEQVNVRMTEEDAAELDDFVQELQRRLGDGVLVGRADGMRHIARSYLRKRARRRRNGVAKSNTARR